MENYHAFIAKCNSGIAIKDAEIEFHKILLQELNDELEYKN